MSDFKGLPTNDAMTSLRRYVIVFQNFHPTKRFALVRSIFPQNFAAISQISSELEGLQQNYVMTSRRRYVIEIEIFDFTKRLALVQSITPLNLVAISTIERVRGFAVK